MPPRYVYWTILAGGLPTAFRAAEKDELLPTFTRIKEKQPDAEMKFFARGRLWDSPEQALRAEDHEARSGGERRGRDWRPGGEHRDPRQPFKDAKKARNQDRRQQRWEHRKPAAGFGPKEDFGRKDRPGPPRDRPQGDPLRDEVAPRPHGDRPHGGPRKNWRDRPPREGRENWRDRPAREGQRDSHRDARSRGFSDSSRNRAPSGNTRSRGSSDARGNWRDRPPRNKPHGDKLSGRPFRPKAQGRPWRRDERGQEPPPPPRPVGPNREPRPGQEPPSEPPPRPTEPIITPPPPERGGEPNTGGKLVRRKRKP